METPNWFNLSDYEYLESLGIQGWAILLSQRKSIENMLTHGDKFDYKSYFENSLLKTHRELIKDPNYFDKDRNQMLTPGVPIEEIFQLEAMTLQKYVDQNISSFHHSFLTVDVNVPDGILIEWFKKWLSKKREDYPTPVKKRSKKYPDNLKIDISHFESWKSYKIIPLWDLETWCKINNIDHNNNKLAHILYPDISDITDEEEKVRNGKKKLKEAFKYADALRAQASSLPNTI